MPFDRANPTQDLICLHLSHGFVLNRMLVRVLENRRRTPIAISYSKRAQLHWWVDTVDVCSVVHQVTSGGAHGEAGRNDCGRLALAVLSV